MRTHQIAAVGRDSRYSPRNATRRGRNGSTSTTAPSPTAAGVAAALREVVNAGSELLLAAGAAATDPLDVVFEYLRQAGGRVLQIGIPAEPGTACWIGSLHGRPVLGLASCELFGQPAP